MPLHSPYTDPDKAERILIFGSAGTGKTTAWLDIAKWLKRTGSESRVFALDSDFSVGWMLTSYPDNDVDLKVAYEWQDYKDFAKHVLTNAKPGDWVVVDFIGKAWTAVRDWYVQEVFHKGIEDYFLQARKQLAADAKNLSALSGWVDYSVINPQYDRWAMDLLLAGQYRKGYHVLCVAQSDTLSSDRSPTEDSNVRSLLLPYGVKPVGQKQLTYQFRTLLLSGRDSRNNTFTLTTVKDRERELLSGNPITSFTVDYLRKIAGWEVA